MYGVRGYDMEIITDSDKTFIYPTVSALGAVDKKGTRKVWRQREGHYVKYVKSHTTAKI